LPRDPDYEPGELFSGQSIAGVLPAASFVVIESREGFSSSQLAELEANNTVVYADPNYSYQLSRTPNDQYFYNQWGMKTGTPRINATSAWDHVTSSDIVVAVVDTGVKYDHPDLDANIWVNKVEQQGDPMLDDDRNGYLNDIHGIDLVLKTGNPMDKSGHGTHCAGVIGAEGDNDKVGVAGVCWMVRIMAIRVFEYSKSKAPAATLAEAIYYAANNGAQVVNCSWGGYKPNDAIKAAIDAAGNGRANAGGDNDLDPFFPASYPMRNIISVLAIDESGALPKLSNYGYHSVDLGAPGISVYSTLANVPYGYASGTSMATPHVSGAAALIWNYPQPGKSYADVKKELLDGAMKLSTLYQRCVTGGTLDLTFVQ
jgi:subtilisin family serine protease